MVAALGSFCNVVGGYIVDVSVNAGDLLCSLIGR